MEQLQLIPYGNPDASEAMSLAHELREEEGLDMGEALSEAWRIINLNERPRPRRRSNPVEGLSVGTLLLVAGLGYFVWCGLKSSQIGTWTWTPWKQTIGRRLPVKPIQQIAGPTMYPSRDGYERVTLIVP